MTQNIVWVVSLALMLLVGFGWGFAMIRSGNRETDYAPLQARAYRLRSRIFWLLVGVFGIPMLYTLIDLPFGVIRPAQAEGTVQEVSVTGYMWYWEFSENQLEAGRPVVFRVTSGDVNHGFAIYDPDMTIVAQTQAMPGVTNIIRHTFTREGTYRVMCLEYCGIAHHKMIAEFTVGKRS